MRKNLWTLGKVVVTIALVYWLIDRVNWEVVGVKLAEVSLPLLFLYVIFQLSGNLISAKKWQRIVNYKGLELTLKESFFTNNPARNIVPVTAIGNQFFFRSFV